MSKSRIENELELGSFGDYLLKSRIVPEKYARYYVGWVRRFLSQAPERAAAALEDRIAVFLDHLRYQVEPWQLDQAEKAVTARCGPACRAGVGPAADLLGQSAGIRSGVVERFFTTD